MQELGRRGYGPRTFASRAASLYHGGMRTLPLLLLVLSACSLPPSLEPIELTSGSPETETWGPLPDTTGGTGATSETTGLPPKPPLCGDAVIEPGEECDFGEENNLGGYGGCEPDCTLAPFCGDGSIDLGHEACDDGNNAGGDGCPSDCGASACLEML